MGRSQEGRGAAVEEAPGPVPVCDQSTSFLKCVFNLLCNISFGQKRLEIKFRKSFGWGIRDGGGAGVDWPWSRE